MIATHKLFCDNEADFYVSLPDWIHILMVIGYTVSLASSLFSNFSTQDENFPQNEFPFLKST